MSTIDENIGLENLYRNLDPILQQLADKLELQLKTTTTTGREYPMREISNFDERHNFLPGHGQDKIYRKMEIALGDESYKSFVVRGYAWYDRESLRHLKMEKLGQWAYNIDKTRELSDILESAHVQIFLRWTIEDLTQKVSLRPLSNY